VQQCEATVESLAGLRVLITGCSSGIGQATALALAAAGVEVFATARALEPLTALEPIASDHRLALDVTDPTAVVETVRLTEPLDALINNAGYAVSGMVEEISDAELTAQYDVNVFGPWRMCRAALPGMRARRRGAIINVSSYGAEMPYPELGAYRSSKAALEAMTATLRLEVARFGIHVVAIQPGLVNTRFADASHAARRQIGDYGALRTSARRVYEKMSPSPGLSPEAVAAVVCDELRRPGRRLRVAVGEDARRNLAVARSGEERWNTYLERELGLDWRGR
jgi:NAD(P)-dependent dehydrogenase (short-subunit alcohol dehydrogenase family)